MVGGSFWLGAKVSLHYQVGCVVRSKLYIRCEDIQIMGQKPSAARFLV